MRPHERPRVGGQPIAHGGRALLVGGSGLFEPDILLPAARAVPGAGTGERALIVAILDCAVLDLGLSPQFFRDWQPRPGARPVPPAQRERLAAARALQASRLRAAALAWLLDDDRTWPFAFRAICETLAFDAQAIRDALLRKLELADPTKRHAVETSARRMVGSRSKVDGGRCR